MTEESRAERRRREREKGEESPEDQKEQKEPLGLPRTFEKCTNCGSTRRFCDEAMKEDLQLETLHGKQPVLLSAEYVYDTPLYPVKLRALLDICWDCGHLCTVVIQKLKGRPTLHVGGEGKIG